MLDRLKQQISFERYQKVSEDITMGSEPVFRFYALVAVSTMIASFGLITNSTAVVIGAMLVAPLMTPIFGISLGLICGDTILLSKAMRAEIAGVFAAVLMGYILGTLYPALEPTPEMLSRTQPQLFDLLVAVFAGFAGSYAMVDEHISPALPGVAIATAIVPPLANTGLCFAVGAYAGGIGSFLLFFANFLSILLVSSFVFWLFGMTKKVKTLRRKEVFKRFGLPLFGFLLVAAFLSHTLYKMAQDQLLTNSIKSALSSEFSNLPATSMEKMIYHLQKGKLYILANVNSPKIVSPRQVKSIQENLSKILKIPTELTVRNTLAQDVSALGTSGQSITQNLDGFFISKTPSPNVVKTRMAEKIIRDYLASEIAMGLHEVELLQIGEGLIVLATIAGFSPLLPEEIERLEKKIQSDAHDHHMNLVVRFIKTDLRDKEGRIQFEWSSVSDLTAKEKAVVEEVKATIRTAFKNRVDLFLGSMSYSVVEGTYSFFIELAGTKILSKDDVKELEQTVLKKVGQPVQLYVWSRPEAVVTPNGYVSYEDATGTFVKSREKRFRGEIEKILEFSE